MRKYEEKVLSQVLQFCNDEKTTPKSMAQTKVNLFLLSVILLVIVSVLYSNNRLNLAVGFILVFISGLLGGGALSQAISNNQWPILKKHISKKSMEERLKEIKT